MRILLLFLLLLQCAIAYAGESGRPIGKNCDLSTPPESAGESSSHGITVRIFPRARDINSQYTGCQMKWLPNGDRWIPFTIVYIEYGDPVRIWSPDDTDPASFSCVYKKGEVIKGDAKNCVAQQSLIAQSLNPGCVEKIRKAVAEGGLAASIPPGCDWDRNGE